MKLRNKCIISILLLLVGWNIPIYVARNEAIVKYEKSRPFQVDSHDFITYGIQYGMNVADVDKLFPSDVDKLLNGKDHEGNWDGSISIYRLPYSGSCLWVNNEIYIDEWYWVFFSQDGKVQKIKRSVSGLGFTYSSERVIELEMEKTGVMYEGENIREKETKVSESLTRKQEQN